MRTSLSIAEDSSAPKRASATAQNSARAKARARVSRRRVMCRGSRWGEAPPGTLRAGWRRDGSLIASVEWRGHRAALLRLRIATTFEARLQLLSERHHRDCWGAGLGAMRFPLRARLRHERPGLAELCPDPTLRRGDSAGQPASLELRLDRPLNACARDVELDRGSRVLRSEEHTSELQSRENLVCRLLLEKNKA